MPDQAVFQNARLLTAAKTKTRIEQKNMCFSATASFVTAAVTSTIGIVSVGRAKERRELPLAATPLFFAFQQSIEGLLWLNLPTAPDGLFSRSLTFLFLFFAQVFWPIYAPTAVLLIEPNKRRRRAMLICLATGIGIAAYLSWRVLAGPHGAVILDNHIVYTAEYQHSTVIALGYLAATGLPLMLSSQRTVVVLGAVILVGSAFAYVLYWEAFFSIWCFFAAAASVLVLCHFEWSRRIRPRVASA